MLRHIGMCIVVHFVLSFEAGLGLPKQAKQAGVSPWNPAPQHWDHKPTLSHLAMFTWVLGVELRT